MGKNRERTSLKPGDIQARKALAAAMIQEGGSDTAISREIGCAHKTVKAVRQEVAANPSGKLAKRGNDIEKERLRRMGTLTDTAMGRLENKLAENGDEALRDLAVVYGIVSDKYLKASGVDKGEAVSVNLVIDTLSSKEQPTIDVSARVVGNE